jgi:hypothetical protein
LGYARSLGDNPHHTRCDQFIRTGKGLKHHDSREPVSRAAIQAVGPALDQFTQERLQARQSPEFQERRLGEVWNPHKPARRWNERHRLVLQPSAGCPATPVDKATAGQFTHSHFFFASR